MITSRRYSTYDCKFELSPIAYTVIVCMILENKGDTIKPIKNTYTIFLVNVDETIKSKLKSRRIIFIDLFLKNIFVHVCLIKHWLWMIKQ